jgi:hypothetical protein
MKFKKNVIGPDFNEADIISFNFGDAEITFALPKDPDRGPGYLAPYDQTQLATASDLHSIVHPLGFRIFNLSENTWCYHDEISERNVVRENCNIKLIEVPEGRQSELNVLSKKALLEWLFTFFRLIAVRGDESLLGSEIEQKNMTDLMMPLSLGSIERYGAGLLSWPMMTISSPYEDNPQANAARIPDYNVYIPLSERWVLYVEHSLYIYYNDHWPDLSRQELIELQRDILLEILSHIKITYSADVLKRIEELNKASEAMIN